MYTYFCPLISPEDHVLFSNVMMLFVFRMFKVFQNALSSSKKLKLS